MYGAYAPQGEFLYDLGSNDDTLNMTVNGGIAADQDFKLLINGNGGNDFINFSFTDLTANQRDNIINGTVNAGHERVIINGGDGNDVIKFWGDGSVTVNGGDGNDAIYVGQNVAQNGVVLFNLTAGHTAFDRAIEVDDVNGAQPLGNDILGIGVSEFALETAGGDAVAAASAGLTVTVSFKGHSTTMNVDTSKVIGNVVTAEFLNEAVAKAIAADTYLSNMIVAKDGAGHSLMIESLVDGVVLATDIVIDFNTTLAANAPVMTDIDGAYNTAATKGQGMLSVDAANEFIAQQGNDAQAEIYGLALNAVAQATGDVYTIKIGDEVYRSAAVTGATDANLVTALNAAVDANGNLFSAKYTAFDVTITDYITGTPGVDDRAISIRHNAGGNQADVTVSLENIGKVAADGTSDGAGTIGTAYNTTSHNVVNAGAGNDTLVLNVNSAIGTATVPLNDIVVLSGPSFGYDHVVNFDYVTTAAAAVDMFDVSAYGATAAAQTTVNSLAALAVAVTGTNTLLTVDQITTGAAAIWGGGNNIGVYAVQIATTNTWQFFHINNANGDAAIANEEVSILGTMTFDAATATAITTAIGGNLGDANGGFFVA